MEMHGLRIIFYSPLIALAICLPLLMIISRFRDKPVFQSMMEWMKGLLLPILVCFGVVFVYVLVKTIMRHSPQEPLVWIFYLPAAVTMGLLSGTLVWIMRGAKTAGSADRSDDNPPGS